ncbi:Lar family restriction alleviation protein [Sphingosinicella xenopeptidilytica]|uniref:Lar family restriction alleviation protein n=1 Tax=Sphingosinicella xenopeptidilytica TaxID=364098 RepID=A0ABW3C1F0_SPHXN
MTTMSEIKPCPFCHSEAEEQTSKGPTGERYRWVECVNCGAMSECCDDSARSNNPDEPEPVELWNTRASDACATVQRERETHASGLASPDERRAGRCLRVSECHHDPREWP